MATLVGVFYAVVAVVSGVLAGAAGSVRMLLMWRWLAFIVSGMAFAWHVLREVSRDGSTVRSTAWHAALAAGIGGFGIALAANVHELTAGSGYRPRILLALVAWPIVTAVPAFLMALVGAAALGAMRRRA